MHIYDVCYFIGYCSREEKAKRIKTYYSNNHGSNLYNSEPDSQVNNENCFELLFIDPGLY